MNSSGDQSCTIQGISLDISTDSLYASSEYLVLEYTLDQDLVLRSFKLYRQGILDFLWLEIGLAKPPTNLTDHTSLPLTCSQWIAASIFDSTSLSAI